MKIVRFDETGWKYYVLDQFVNSLLWMTQEIVPIYVLTNTGNNTFWKFLKYGNSRYVLKMNHDFKSQLGQKNILEK